MVAMWSHAQSSLSVARMLSILRVRALPPASLRALPSFAQFFCISPLAEDRPDLAGLSSDDEGVEDEGVGGAAGAGGAAGVSDAAGDDVGTRTGEMHRVDEGGVEAGCGSDGGSGGGSVGGTGGVGCRTGEMGRWTDVGGVAADAAEELMG